MCLDYVTPPCCSDDSELDLLQRNRSGVASPKRTVLISKHTRMCLVYLAVQGGAVPAREFKQRLSAVFTHMYLIMFLLHHLALFLLHENRLGTC